MKTAVFFACILLLVACDNERPKPDVIEPIYINVTDPIFGAMPNDSIPDNIALQRAFDFCLRMNKKNQKADIRIYIPEGQYLIVPDSLIDWDSQTIRD